jgi:hypothetical protein
LYLALILPRAIMKPPFNRHYREVLRHIEYIHMF